MHEPIISEETYEKTMRLMEARSDIRRRNSDYLLTGLIVCGKCGAKMRYQKWGKDKCKIVCYSHDKSKPHLVKDENCNNPPIDVFLVEDAVKEDLFSFSVKKKSGKIKEEILNVSDILRERLSDGIKKLKRLYALYANGDDDILLDAINEQKAEIEEIKEKLKEEEKKSEKSKTSAEVKKKLETIADTWDYMEKSEKRAVILSVVERIVINEEEISIYYKI